MSLESDLYARLAPLVGDRVFPDVQPIGTSLPCIVYQQVGGEAVGFVEAAKPSKKNARMQVRTWASTRMAASALARQVEDSLITSSTLLATAIGALIADYDDELQEFGTIQDFSIWYDD